MANQPPAHTFPLEPITRFQSKSSTAIKAPREIAHFSFDSNHMFRLDDSSLRYYYTPQLGADLSLGFDTFDRHDDSTDEHLDGLLKALLDSEEVSGRRTQADVVTWRGMMTKLMTAVWERFDGFDMRATFFDGTLFIEEDHAAKMRRNPARPDPEMARFQYWGYKFETLALIPDTWDATSRDAIEAREQEAVCNKAQYCSIVRTSIGATSLVMGGEVDAIWDAKPADPAEEAVNYVELKTAQRPGTQQEAVKLERKLCRMWAQSFLLGVPRLIVGLRSRDGILLELLEKEVRRIPGEVKRGFNTWDGNVCIRVLEATLSWLKEVIGREGEGGVWRIFRRPKGAEIVVERVQNEGEGHGGILLEEFVLWRRGLREKEAREVAALLAGSGSGDSIGDGDGAGDGPKHKHEEGVG